MANDRGGNALTDLTSQQLMQIALRALKETARDIDERRVPLDGRVRPEAYEGAALVREPSPAK